MLSCLEAITCSWDSTYYLLLKVKTSFLNIVAADVLYFELDLGGHSAWGRTRKSEHLWNMPGKRCSVSNHKFALNKLLWHKIQFLHLILMISMWALLQHYVFTCVILKKIFWIGAESVLYARLTKRPKDCCRCLSLTYLLGIFSALLLTLRLAGAVLLHSRHHISVCQLKCTNTHKLFLSFLTISMRSKLQ